MIRVCSLQFTLYSATTPQTAPEVALRLRRSVGEAMPARWSRSRRRTSLAQPECPRAAARVEGVRPSESTLPTSTPASSKTRTAPAAPAAQAACSGVAPRASAVSRPQPPSSNCRASLARPCSHAWCSAVRPSASAASGRPRFDASHWSTGRSSPWAAYLLMVGGSAVIPVEIVGAALDRADATLFSAHSHASQQLPQQPHRYDHYDGHCKSRSRSQRLRYCEALLVVVVILVVSLCCCFGEEGQNGQPPVVAAHDCCRSRSPPSCVDNVLIHSSFYGFCAAWTKPVPTSKVSNTVFVE